LLEIPSPKDSLIIVATSLKYMVQVNGKIKQTVNKKFMPSAVVGFLSFYIFSIWTLNRAVIPVLIMGKSFDNPDV
jgi:hypothetical protein